MLQALKDMGLTRVAPADGAFYVYVRTDLDPQRVEQIYLSSSVFATRPACPPRLTLPCCARA